MFFLSLFSCNIDDQFSPNFQFFLLCIIMLGENTGLKQHFPPLSYRNVLLRAECFKSNEGAIQTCQTLVKVCARTTLINQFQTPTHLRPWHKLVATINSVIMETSIHLWCILIWWLFCMHYSWSDVFISLLFLDWIQPSISGCLWRFIVLA